MNVRTICPVLLALALALPLARPVHADNLVELSLSGPPELPSDAPDAVVHVPSHYDPSAPLHVVVFLHGFSCCARALMAKEDTTCAAGEASAHGFDLAALHEAAGTSTLLVVPQLAFVARSPRAERLERPGGLDALIEAAVHEGLAAAPGGSRPRSDVKQVSLVAHSGGYRAVADVLRDSARRTPVNDVVLLDALYAELDTFVAFVAAQPHALLLSLYTHDPRTRGQNGQLLRRLGAQRSERVKEDHLLALLQRGRARVSEVQVAHRALPAHFLTPIVRALAALPPSTPHPNAQPVGAVAP